MAQSLAISVPAAAPANLAVSFGANTLKGFGGAPVDPLGRATGAISIVSGNTGSVWAIDSHKCLVPAGTFGAAAPSYSGPYTLGLSDGAHSWTASVAILPNTYHVAAINSGTNADTSGSDQTTTTLALAALALGDTVYVRSGDYNPSQWDWRVSRTAAPTGSWSGSNWVMVIAEAPLASTYHRLSCDGAAQGPQYIKFKQVAFQRTNTAGADGVSTGCLSGLNGASFLALDRCSFVGEDNRADGSVDGVTLCSGFIALNPGSGDFTITDNTFAGLDCGIVAVGPNQTITGNVMRQIWQDCIHQITSYNNTVSWNFCYDKRYETGGAHGDFLQVDNLSLANGTYAGWTIIGNVCVRATGSATWAEGQGYFLADTPAGVSFTGTQILGNIYVGTFARGVTVTNETSSIIRWNTLVEDQTSGIVNPSTPNPPGVFLSNGAAGNVDYNAVCIATTLEGSQTALTTNTGEVVLAAPAGFAGAFAAPAYGTSTDTLAEALVAWSMKPGGTLDKATTGFTYHVGAAGTGYVDFVNRTTSFPL